jgi:phenylacetate-CoA ligase
MTAFKAGAMDQLQVEIEIASDSQASDSQTTNSQASDLVTKIHQAFETRLGFRVDVQPVENGTLPRFEAKGKRFIDNRQ